MEETDSKLKNLIVVGDRVLIRPKKISNKTKAGLFLPPGYQEKEEIMFNDEKYFIVSQNSILLLERDEELFA